MSNISLSRPLASGLALILCLGLVGLRQPLGVAEPAR